MQVPLSRPDITDLERRYASQVLDTPQLSLGPKLSEFENLMASFVGTRHAVAVSSGTAGLHLVVKALGIGSGDEVITTPFSFVASANCILMERATPVFVDSDPQTFNIDPDLVEDLLRRAAKSGRRFKAILPVHVFGQPCEMDQILCLARKHDLAVVEDACEALGALYYSSSGPKKAGTMGDAGIFGFYPNKQITTGEGGMVVTDDEKIAQLCRSMRNQGRDDDAWLLHSRLGFNYRISEINCALGIAQMERIEELLEKRNRVAEAYNRRLEGVEGISVPFVGPHVKMSWFVYVVRLDECYHSHDRDRLLELLRTRGIACSNYFPPIHLQTFYAEQFGYKPGDFPVTESVSQRAVALPFYGGMSEEEMNYVVENLKEILPTL